MRLDDDVHQKLKLKTIQDGFTIQSFIQQLVESYLEFDGSANELLEKIQK